jgi:hypothetical protein
MVVASKPQIRSLFPTPLVSHFLPVAADVNAALRPLILERAQLDERGQGWSSGSDVTQAAGDSLQTLFRVARDLADSLTATRGGQRVVLDWKIEATASVRVRSEHREFTARPGALWSGIYYVDDGYAKSDDLALGGECEFADPRGRAAAMIPPEYGYRVPGGATAGQSESIRPQTGMIILHPSWLVRAERRYNGDYSRVTIEFDLSPP